MTTIPIPSGPTNKEIIDRAYQALGNSDSMFGRTPEEYADAVLALGAMMAEWPFNLLGYIPQDAAGLRVEEESGISREWLNAVGYSLAEQLAPVIGKQMQPEAVRIRAKAYARLCSTVGAIPAAPLNPPTVRGSGASRFGYPYGRTFFPVDS